MHHHALYDLVVVFEIVEANWALFYNFSFWLSFANLQEVAASEAYLSIKIARCMPIECAWVISPKTVFLCMIEHWNLLSKLDNLVYSAISFLFVISFFRWPWLVHEIGTACEKYHPKSNKHYYISLYDEYKTQHPKSFLLGFFSTAFGQFRSVNEGVSIDIPSNLWQENKDEKEEVYLDLKHSRIFCFPPKSNKDEPSQAMEAMDNKIS